MALFSLLRRNPAPRPRQTVKPLTVAGVAAPLELCVSPRARRMSLRVDTVREVVRVVVPHGVPEEHAARFVVRHLDWVRRRLASVPPRLPFAVGRKVPVLGVPHRIRHDPLHRGGVRRQEGPEGPELLVGGPPEFLARRVRDWLRTEARRLLAERARAKAALIGARVAAVGVRDTRARWGSCSHDGRLSFSWRLILAPEPVLDYVVVHEVAHLKELNHSPRFWALCARLAGGTTPVEDAKAWLKTNGAGLHRYGLE